MATELVAVQFTDPLVNTPVNTPGTLLYVPSRTQTANIYYAEDSSLVKNSHACRPCITNSSPRRAPLDRAHTCTLLAFRILLGSILGLDNVSRPPTLYSGALSSPPQLVHTH